MPPLTEAPIPGRLIAALPLPPGASSYLGQARARLAPDRNLFALQQTPPRLAVIGAGRRGREVAHALLRSGCDVCLIDAAAEALATAQAYLRAAVEPCPDRSGARVAAGSLRTGTDICAVADAEMVLEAVPETLPLKVEVLTQAAGYCTAETILASCTSALDLGAIAAALPLPDRVVGLPFPLPSGATDLLELVTTPHTSPRVAEAVQALTACLGKIAVITRDCGGALGGRLFARFHQEAMYLVEEGAWPEDVDRALEDWGMRIGPFHALDMIGNDISCRARQQRLARDHGAHRPVVGELLCEAGLLGRKSGKGWYIYDAEAQRGRPYEESRVVVLRSSAQLRLARRNICAAEIVDRCLTGLVLEAAHLLQQGSAGSAPEIDLVAGAGLGFPADRGGPVFLGAQLGAREICAKAAHFAQATPRDRGRGRWQVSPALGRALELAPSAQTV